MTALIATATQAIGSRLRAPGRHRLAVVMAKLRGAAGTLAAMAAADFGGFRVWHNGGWFVVAVSVLLLDWALSG